MSNSSSTASGGVSLGTVLVAIFVTLKLTGVIDWSWWLVFLPWLISAGIVAVFLLIAAVLGLIGMAVDRSTERRRRNRW